VVAISAFAYFYILGAWAAHDEIECEVEVVVTVTGKQSYENTLIEIAFEYDGHDDYKVPSKRVMANPEGIASITFTLERTGSYEVSAHFMDDPDGPMATKGFTLDTDDDGGSKEIGLDLHWTG
jgi:hypothetical protein